MSQISSDKSAHAPGGVITVEEPPARLFGILSRLGPGLIIAGSIVGSGELIATTKTGAEAGFWLLWLIAVGCVIKVFCQVELGRYTITTGKSSLDAFTEVPGPRVAGHGNWLVWYWFLMWLASIAQLGGIVGGVGQAMAISVPITQAGRDYNEYMGRQTTLVVTEKELERYRDLVGQGAANLQAEIPRLEREVAQLQAQMAALPGKPPNGHDDKLWATLFAIATSLLLVVGRYGFIQSFSTVLVAGFTFVTVVNVILLQSNPIWGATWTDLANGWSFRLPPKSDVAPGVSPLATALFTFGIIGVGASELVGYPYWCLEKGYARFTGPKDKSPEWGRRARGWMRVMQWDAWCSMVVYTFATLAFYLLGASILHRVGLNPGGLEMVRTLSVMYKPVFGALAQSLFLFGALAVLYSTFFVANATHARTFSDALGVMGVAASSPESYRRRVRILSGVFPILCLAFYWSFPKEPEQLVLLSGLMQAMMLPMLAAAAIYFRFRRSDARLRPGRVWDAFLWISAAGMTVAGVWAGWEKIAPYVKWLFE